MCVCIYMYLILGKICIPTMKGNGKNNSDVIISQNPCPNILMEQIFATLVFTKFIFVVLPQIMEVKF